MEELNQVRPCTAVAVRMMMSEMISWHLRKTTEGESTSREQIDVKKLRIRGLNPKLSYQQTCGETDTMFP